MKEHKGTRKYCWDDMPKETVTPLLDRRLITGHRMMLAHVYLKKGCIVPLHHHENEQLTYVLEGALKFWIGDEHGETIVIGPGEVLFKFPDDTLVLPGHGPDTTIGREKKTNPFLR